VDGVTVISCSSQEVLGPVSRRGVLDQVLRRHLYSTTAINPYFHYNQLASTCFADTTLEAELFLHDNSSRLKRRKAKFSSAAELPPECRVMSLSSFPLTSCVAGDRDANSLVGYHYVAVGCSDALIRYASLCTLLQC
jgi:hypothetical protein